MITFYSQSQEVAVTFPSDNLMLEGTLALPSGSGPYSTILLVHGSGPNDRDQTLELTGGNAACLYPNLLGETIRNFKNISDSLVELGFAVLRYDKRTFTHGAQLNPKTISPNDFITDVHNAIDYLKSRSEVDSGCISLLGHSQGASLVPIVANQRNDISSVICLGTPATRIDTLMAQQFRDLYFICLNDSSTGNAYYNQTLNDFHQIRTGSWNSNTPYLGAYPLFWNDWMDIAESSISDFNSLTVPVTIIHGADDFNVPLNDFQKLQAAITNPVVEFELLPGINHYLTNPTSPLVDESVMGAISSFLTNIPCLISSISEEKPIDAIQVVYSGSDLVIQSKYTMKNIRVFDSTGKLCLSNIGANIISAATLKPGIYVVQLHYSNSLETVKVFIP